MALDENTEFELTQYLDGQLKGARKRRLQRRLDQDPLLRQELARFGALEGNLAELGQVEFPEADCRLQREQIIASLERRSLLGRPARRLTILRPSFVFSAATAAAAIVAAVMLWPAFTSSESTGGAAKVELAVNVVLPEPPSSEVESVIVFRQLPQEELPPRVEQVLMQGESEVPSGTIVVSAGGTSPEGAAPWMFEFYEL